MVNYEDALVIYCNGVFTLPIYATSKLHVQIYCDQEILHCEHIIDCFL